jgi:hypothetical protein
MPKDDYPNGQEMIYVEHGELLSRIYGSSHHTDTAN